MMFWELDLGCCRGTGMFSHLSGTLYTYTAPVALPADPGHPGHGVSPWVGITGFGFSGHQHSQLLGRAGICQSEDRQNIQPPGKPPAGECPSRSARGGLESRAGRRGGGNNTLGEALPLLS